MKYLLALTCLVSFSGWSQSQYGTDKDTNLTVNQLSVNTYVGYQTTSLERKISGKMLFGGNITSDVITASSEKHGAINKLGVQWLGTFDYYHGSGKLFKKEEFSWLVKGGTYSFNQLSYSKDLFDLLFKGNQSFIGDTANLSGLNLDMYSFQKIGFGVFRKKDKSSVSLNYVNLQNYQSAYLSEAKLIQNTDGSQLEFDLDGELKRAQGNRFDKGSGFSVDVDYRFPINIGPKRIVNIQLVAENVGFVYVKNGMKTYETDSTYQFNGFQFNQLNTEYLSRLDSITVLDTLGISSKESKPWIALPMLIQASKMIDLIGGSRFQSYFGVRFYPTVQVTPIVFGGVYYRFNPNFSARTSIAYGGFGGVRLGLYGSYVSDKMRLALGTDELIGWLTKKGKGQSILLKFTWNLSN